MPSPAYRQAGGIGRAGRLRQAQGINKIRFPIRSRMTGKTGFPIIIEKKKFTRE
jgi:hypothetical protein